MADLFAQCLGEDIRGWSIGCRVECTSVSLGREAFGSSRGTLRCASCGDGVEQLRRDAAEQEADGWSAMTSSYSQIQSSLHNLAIAAENLSISTYSYQEGQATVLDVLQAQISWLQLYTNAITARFNYAVAVSDYQRITAWK